MYLIADDSVIFKPLINENCLNSFVIDVPTAIAYLSVIKYSPTGTKAFNKSVLEYF